MNSLAPWKEPELLADYLLQRLHQIEPKLKQVTVTLLQRMAAMERGRVPLLEVVYLVKMAIELQQLLSAWWECCLVVEGMLLQPDEPVSIGFAIAYPSGCSAAVEESKPTIASVELWGQGEERAAA